MISIQSWASKIISDMMYEKMAKHCVKIADAVLNELMTTEFKICSNEQSSEIDELSKIDK